MKRYTAAQVTVSSGSKIVTVHSGEPIELVRQGGNLEIGQFNGVNIFNAYYADGTNKPTIELYDPWPHATQTLKSAVVVPTAVHFNTAATVLGETNTKIFQQLASFLDLGTQPTGTVTFKAVGVGDTDLVIKSLPQYKADLDELESFATGSVDTFTLLDEQLNGDGGLVEVSAQIQADLTTSGGTLLGYVNTTEGYMNTALGYRDTAKTYQDNAKSYRDTAYSYHNAVSGWYGTISGWKTATENARDLAESYMNQAEAFKNAAGEIVGNDFVTLSTEVNGKPLTGNINLDMDDLKLTGTSRVNNPLVHLFSPSAIVEKLQGALQVERNSVATYPDKYGFLQIADVDEIRVNNRGVLVERRGFNLLDYSVPVVGAWENPRISITSDLTHSPTGAVDAHELSITSESLAYLRPQTIINFTAGDLYTISFFGKAITLDSVLLRLQEVVFGNTAQMEINLSEGSVSNVTNKVVDYTVESFADGWNRYSMTAEAIATVSSKVLILYPVSPEVNDRFCVWGFQVEANPFLSSYIPSNGVAAERRADVISILMEGNWPTKTKGAVTVTCEASTLYEGTEITFAYLFGVRISSTNSVLGRFLMEGYETLVTNDGVSVGVATPAIRHRNETIKLVNTLSSSSSSVSATVDGVLNAKPVTEDIWADIGEHTHISIGGYTNDPLAKLYGYIKNFRIYDVELTEDEVKLL